MKKQIGKNLMQKWKNKIRVRLSALDKKKLVLTNIPYILTAFYTNRASFLYRNSPGKDIGNKLLYAMEHADRILTGLQPSFNWCDMLTGIVVAVILKLLVWQKQSDAKKLRKGIEYGSARWGNAEDIKPYMSEDPWMNIPLTATEALTMESRPKQPKYARNKNIVVIGGSGSGKTRFFVKPSVMQMNCSMVITDPKGLIYKVQRNKRCFTNRN
ncbi:type IV secretory system conjugative DNA transfer family protein [Mediterraneibacter faecis]|uniref:type IV secretory system conjugative DNA transfer family protein n=1 Tax=Mediterraneibacter faecis TaxID=592978 RepID=UPI001FAD1823|nr:type IV secretory system conjugative DNA transfer family protein [Mediterraneibacter faecis]